FLSPVTSGFDGLLLVQDGLFLDAQALALAVTNRLQCSQDCFHKSRAEFEALELFFDLSLQIRYFDILTPVTIGSPGGAVVIGLVLRAMDFSCVAVAAEIAEGESPQQEVVGSPPAGVEIVRIKNL